MIVVDPGHSYLLNLLDSGSCSTSHSELVFVKRMGEIYPGNTSSHAGTNIQEVIRACIDRVKYLDNQIPCYENKSILLHLRLAIWWLELRAAMRHNRKESIADIDVHRIESEPTCPKCGHIRCTLEKFFASEGKEL